MSFVTVAKACSCDVWTRQNEASAAESEAKQAKLKAKHLEKELAAKRKLLATKDKESQKLDKVCAARCSR